MSALLVASCSGDGSTVETVRLVYQHEMVSFDPHGQNDAVTGAILSAVYEALVSLSAGRTIEPCLAEQWTTPDDTTWRFRIRSDVRFHDGSPLTVVDVVSSVRRARFGAASALATYMEVIDDVAVVSEQEHLIEVSTTAPFPLLLTRLAMVAIVPAVFEPNSPIGTGPYRWLGGNLTGPVVLERWEGYWGDAADVGMIRVSFVDDHKRLGQLIADNEIDVAAVSSLDFFDSRDLPPGWRAVWIPSSGTTILGINMQHSPFDDPRVREAVDLALDRHDLVRSVFPEGATEPAMSLVPPEAFGFNPAERRAPADPERARALLEAAEVAPGSVVHLEHAGIYGTVVEHVAAALVDVGFQVEPVELSYEGLYRRIELGDTELFLFGWNFRWADASDFLDAVVHTRDPTRRLGLLNGSGYSSPRLDRWVETAAREAKSAPRLELMRKALSLVAADRPYLPLFHHSRFALVREPFSIDVIPGTLVQPRTIRRAGR